MSNWRNEQNTPDVITCQKLAEITGMPLVKIIGIAGEARAISREEKAVWRKVAGAVMMAVMLLPILSVMTGKNMILNKRQSNHYANSFTHEMAPPTGFEDGSSEPLPARFAVESAIEQAAI